MLLVGLTGNYGMGKTSVLKMFENQGALTINSDKIVREVLSEKAVKDKIREALGNKVFDSKGRLIKKRVSDIIFKDRSLRHAIEEIIHPLVFKEIERLTHAKNGIAIVEAPVLFERGYESRFHKTITVYTDEETAMRRLEKQGVSRDEIRKRLSTQMPITEKIKRSDYTLNNSATPQKTKAQVRSIYRELLRKG